jgi:two-component system response regulator DesR
MADPRKPLILVVDDSDSVANTLALVLQASGYVTAVAYSGKEAVQMVSGIAADAAIVDVNLPDVDGVRTAVEICNRLPNCKILLISGHP